MDADALGRAHQFDVIVLELGILHYHQDLDRFFSITRKLTAHSGPLVRNEFHPGQRKLFWLEGPKDYLSADLMEADVPNHDSTDQSLGRCRYRFWTMGEIVTSVVRAAFALQAGPTSRLDRPHNS